ncbi:MAG: 5'-nucleotidase C-terminal domain-containing protein [Bacteroidia bacterium]|nr:5'-nucleotidase C-terminal domain-containing protein [Bacteroidia bacterium]
MHYKSDDGHGVDFCLLNNGGLRASLPHGDITRGKIFELMPFENEMIVLELNGETTLELVDFIAEKGGMPVSGIRFEIENQKPTNITINGKAFDKNKTYKVVTSDYLAHGGDKLAMLKKRLNDKLTGVKIRDAIIEYFVEQNNKGVTITSSLDGRIKYAH